MDKKIEIPITVKMQVDKSTAAGCLTVAEWYANQNGMKVVSERQENGEVQLRYVPVD